MRRIPDAKSSLNPHASVPLVNRSTHRSQPLHFCTDRRPICTFARPFMYAPCPHVTMPAPPRGWEYIAKAGARRATPYQPKRCISPILKPPYSILTIPPLHFCTSVLPPDPPGILHRRTFQPQSGGALFLRPRLCLPAAGRTSLPDGQVLAGGGDDPGGG